MEENAKQGKWKKLLLKYGMWGIIFFIVKGTISTILIILGLDAILD